MQLCRCLGLATTDEIGKNGKKRKNRISGQTGSGNLDLWAFLESSGQVRSVGTPTIPVSALGEPQLRQTGKKLFSDEPGLEIRIYGHFWNPQVKPDPWVPLPFLYVA